MPAGFPWCSGVNGPKSGPEFGCRVPRVKAWAIWIMPCAGGSQRSARDRTPATAQNVVVLPRSNKCTLQAAKVKYGAIDRRTTRHPGYAISQRKRKLIEQVFGWMKTIGLLRKLRHRGGETVDWIVTLTAAAYNLVRLRTLLGGT